MSKIPVRVALKDPLGKVVDESTLYVSGHHKSDSHTFHNLPPNGGTVEYTAPEGYSLDSSTYRLTGDEDSIEVGINLQESQPASNVVNSDSQSLNSPLEPILWLTAISLLVFGTLTLPIDFFSKLFSPKTPQSPSVSFSTGTRKESTIGQREITLELTTTPVEKQSVSTNSSQFVSGLRACFEENLRDITEIPTLSDLAKKVTLLEVSDKQIRDQALQLYENVDRFRKMLKGCDPKLAKYLLEVRNSTIASNQLISIPSTAVTATRSLFPITISNCNGTESSANFRVVPAPSQAVILGFVPQGQQVYLTGKTISHWHEAIAPGAVPDPGKVISPNQPGWIASCFVQN